jgi:hypothetical protein
MPSNLTRSYDANKYLNSPLPSFSGSPAAVNSTEPGCVEPASYHGQKPGAGGLGTRSAAGEAVMGISARRSRNFRYNPLQTKYFSQCNTEAEYVKKDGNRWINRHDFGTHRIRGGIL